MRRRLARLACIAKGHPKVRMIEQEGALAEDVTAGTGRVFFSGWCDTCGRFVHWTEDYAG